MTIDGLHTYTINYKRRRNRTTTTTTTTKRQRWPVTRSGALRKAIKATLLAIAPHGQRGPRAYQWVRVKPPVPKT